MRHFTKPILILLFTHILLSINAQIVSQTDGDWNDASTWVGGTIPLIANDATINHAVTINGVGVCKDLTINGGGSLNCMGLSVLTIGTNPNGGNNSMVVEGSLTMSIDCKMVLRGNASFGANSNWTMNGGTFEIDGNNGVPANSVANGTSLIDVTGTGIKNILGGTIQFIDPHAVIGNFLIEGSATFISTIKVGDGTATDTNTPFSFGDDIIFSDVDIDYIESPLNFTSFGMSNTLKGNLGMNSGRLISNNLSKFEGNITCVAPAAIEGKVVCMGLPTYISGNGSFLDATIQTSVPASSGNVVLMNNLTVGNLILNNSLELDGNTLRVDGNILGSGIVTFDGGGTLKRNIAMGTSALFSIGVSTNYAPVTISNTTASTVWTVNLSTTPNTPPSNSKMVQMQWDIKPNIVGTQADITVQWDNADEEVGFVRATSALHHWNGASWDRITPNTGPTGNAGTTYSITKTSWSNFSPFAVFSQASLPVELVSFTGKAQQRKALLTWATASEKNNAGFDIEKSLDGKNFDKIAFVKGNGISTITQNYNFTDYNFTQNAYYRLKQVDLDGTFEYSKTIALNTEGGKNKSVIKSYPNPVSDALTVETSVAETSQLEIIDAVGRVVLKQNVESGNYQISTSSLVKGMYILRLSNKNDISVQKIIKN